MSNPREQYGPNNSGAMNMWGGHLGNYGPQCGQPCPPPCPPSCPPPRPSQCLPPCPPSCPPPCPPGRSGAPYMQWGQGNLGGFNVSNPGGGSDNIYGSAAAGSGNMAGKNTISGPRNAYGQGGVGGQRGGPSPISGGIGTSGDDFYGQCPPYGGIPGSMDATNVTNPAFADYGGPVNMAGSNISISNTATYLSRIAPRTGGEYGGRLVGGDMKSSEYPYDNARGAPEQKNLALRSGSVRDNVCENCGNICRQTGGMDHRSEEFMTKEVKLSNEKEGEDPFQDRELCQSPMTEIVNDFQTSYE